MTSDPAIEKAFAELIAAMMPEFESFMRERLRAAFAAGLSIGQERNQNVFAEAAQKALEAMKALQAATSAVEAKAQAPSAPPKAARANGGYSGVADAVRKTVRDIGGEPEGVDGTKMLAHIHDALGRKDITDQQIRSSLAMLSRTGEVIRLKRGHYRPGPRLQVAQGNGASLFQQQPIAMQ